MEIVRRGRAWRLLGAMGILTLAAMVAPLTLLVPPHALWLMGVLTTGAIFAWRRWQERYTLVAMEAHCPRCSAELSRRRPTRLRRPHPMPCDECHHHAVLVVEVEG